mmetsp:Transcript_172566/g.547901  ORF Transcript_172566/g.547901 Transcript_172566/m.547901 type:complete len:307 (+) Transcript_172566:222-1142(+)
MPMRMAVSIRKTSNLKEHPQTGLQPGSRGEPKRWAPTQTSAKASVANSMACAGKSRASSSLTVSAPTGRPGWRPGIGAGDGADVGVGTDVGADGVAVGPGEGGLPSPPTGLGEPRLAGEAAARLAAGQWCRPRRRDHALRAHPLGGGCRGAAGGLSRRGGGEDAVAVGEAARLLVPNHSFEALARLRRLALLLGPLPELPLVPLVLLALEPRRRLPALILLAPLPRLVPLQLLLLAPRALLHGLRGVACAPDEGADEALVALLQELERRLRLGMTVFVGMHQEPQPVQLRLQILHHLVLGVERGHA